MTEANPTREQILDIAQDLLQRRSSAGVSFQELANQVGIKKGSMYYHFESKESLLVALLQRARAQFVDAMKSMADEHPKKQLRFYFNIFGDYFGASHKMCPGGSFAAVWDLQSEDVRASAQQLLDAHRAALERILAKARAANILRPAETSDRELAVWIASTLQGALTTSRIMQDPAWFKTTARQLEQALFLPT